MNEIIFAGNGEIGSVCLKILQINIKTIYIVNTEDRKILDLKRNSDFLIDRISDSKCDIVFLAGWFKIIKKNELINKKYLNIHGSLLPKYRGIHSIFCAIMNFEKYLGYTIHEVNEFIDDGDIIYQYKFRYKNHKINEIQKLFYVDLEKNLYNTIFNYYRGKTKKIKQNKKHATWVCKRNLEDCIIDFNKSIKYIERFFLALSSPYPLPIIVIKNRYYEVINYKLIQKKYYCEVGRVVNIDNDGVWIKIKDGIMVISSLMSSDDKNYYNPQQIMKIGQRLN
jgi:methionyl-tRNA formyltransferase